MNYLLYRSVAVDDLSSGDMFELVQAASQNNVVHGITGFLIFSGGQFMQFIEGSESELGRLLANLEDDPRHRDLIILSQGKSERRSFPKWRMRRVVLNDGAAVGLNNVGVEEFLAEVRVARVPEAVFDEVARFMRNDSGAS